MKPIHKKIVNLGLAALLTGASAKLAFDSFKGPSSKKPEIRTSIKFAVDNVNPKIKDPFEDIFTKRRIGPELAWHAVINLSGFERVLFFNNLKRNQPRDAYRLLERYMVETSKAYDLDPEIVKYLFFRRQFDLRNPIGVEDPGLIRKYLGRDVNARIFNDDPFLGIDVAVRYLRDLAQKKRRVGKEQILTEYLFGPFNSGKSFQRKLKVVKALLEKSKSEYMPLFRKILLRAPGNKFFEDLRFNMDNYPKYSLEKYTQLSNKEKLKVLFDFAHFVAGQLDLDPVMLLKVMKIESEFNNTAENSYSKALGLMQIKPILYSEFIRQGLFSRVFGRNLNFEELKDPYYNIVVGALTLKYCMLNLGNDPRLALPAYNIGFGEYTDSPNSAKNIGVSQRYLEKYDKIDLSQIFL
jgi:soluble lytic murein transglycosylase-like protein